MISELLVESFIACQVRRKRKDEISGKLGKLKPGVKCAGIFILLCFNLNVTFSQGLWRDTTLLEDVKSGIHATYNFEFDKADSYIDAFHNEYPNHPAILVYEALVLYWRYYPILAETQSGDTYEALLLKSLSASERYLEKSPNHQLTNFMALLPRLLLLQYYADNDLTMSSIPHISKAYRAVIKGFEYTQTTPEFYFTSGLYNYYREAYPEANPFYKPIVFFFPEGNKKKGLNELYACWQQSELVGAEALSFLSYIYINFESNYPKGIEYTSELVKKYPGNILFAQYYIQLLLLNKQYDEAEKEVNRIKQEGNLKNFFKISMSLYDAVIKERYHKKYSEAEKIYKLTITSMKPYGYYGNRYLAYAYFGLCRINKKYGSLEKADRYRKSALEYAQYPDVNFD